MSPIPSRRRLPFLGTLSGLGHALSLALVVGVAVSSAEAQTADPEPVRLVATARQMGPVAYRDPLGAVSPDGLWLAYTSGSWLRLVHTAGGPVRTLGRFARVLSLAWLPGGEALAVLATDELGRAEWRSVDVRRGTVAALWRGPFPGAAGDAPTDPREFREAAWSSDGGRLAGILSSGRGSSLWTGNADGTAGSLLTSANPLSFPAWLPDGRTLACLIRASGRQRMSIPCGSMPTNSSGLEAYGPLAFSPGGGTVYFASPSDRGTLELYRRPVGGGPARRLTGFARDSYAPSVTRDGRVLFGTQDYRLFIATAPAAGGPTHQVTAFQSETPSFSRNDGSIAFTFGTWRRVVDDINYPDIAQDLGLVSTDAEPPAAAPETVVRASPSEDQGLDWSPDGRWIVLHSHADGSDDLWLQPADGSEAAHKITTDGYETGWPRWSPDGRWILYNTEVSEGGGFRGVLYLLGIDAATGRVTREARPISLTGVQGSIQAADWVTRDSVAFLALDGIDQQTIYLAHRQGGGARVVHHFTSEQRFSGLGISAAGRWAAYVAPASDGFIQVFRVPLDGGTATQVTSDPSDKTQPSVSRDGSTIAFTVFTYQTQFWMMGGE